MAATRPPWKVPRMTGLPRNNALIAAVATPIGPDLRPGSRLLVERCRFLLAEGCDGIALFGTTGEGAEFAVEDRQLAQESLLAAGIAPARLIVYVGALALPDISGIALAPPVIRRLSERYPRLVAGVKDSGGDLGFTEDLLRRFSHLRIFTGTETHIPAVLASGGAGTICGLANVIPGLLRLMSDGWTLPDRRRYVPMVQAVDNILSRGPFIPALKAVIADETSEPAWRRVVPPMAELALADEQRLLADFRRLATAFPRAPLAPPARSRARTASIAGT